MYYKKRPELISMVEDFYRTHRSLAERYDQVKSESGTRLPTPWSSPLSFTKYRLEKSLSLSLSLSLSDDKAYDSYSEAYGPEESEESEVDDPEEEEEMLQNHVESETEQVSSGAGHEELMKLREEVERLREENKVQKEQLMQKDEEKRDVIRQLSLAMDLLREENVKLRQCLAKNTPKRENQPEYNKLKEGFFGSLTEEESGIDPDGANAIPGPGDTVASGFGGLGLDGIRGIEDSLGESSEPPGAAEIVEAGKFMPKAGVGENNINIEVARTIKNGVME
ncbi:UNVERIFIED_CONTAM: protein NETWORKED 3A [Sesamum calycinum]|uniref:Protein NETWORKED 3A n=1 Tax=Sesamum calycinum TaxID=2727403 RepID=A0AAW2SBR7_9LAMI